jgi:hypothetical protein
MSSPTTSPPTAGSTSTSGTASTDRGLPTLPVAPLPARVPLRRKLSNLIAVRAHKQEQVRVIGDAGEAVVDPGDWVILQDTYVIQVVKDKDFPPAAFEIITEGALTIPRGAQELLEETLGVGSCRSPVELIAAVQRLASIRIGDVRIPFTPGQLEELQHRAKKRGQSIEQAVKAVVDRIRDELFWKG